MSQSGRTDSRTAALGRKAIAAVILLVAAWVLLHFIIHIAVAIASVAVVIIAIFALIWAARVLL
ncbi:MAG: hypothetical protein ACR2ND_00520 [Solirubrobacteraceae bacterium]